MPRSPFMRKFMDIISYDILLNVTFRFAEC